MSSQVKELTCDDVDQQFHIFLCKAPEFQKFQKTCIHLENFPPELFVWSLSKRHAEWPTNTLIKPFHSYQLAVLNLSGQRCLQLYIEVYFF